LLLSITKRLFKDKIISYKFLKIFSVLILGVG